LREKRVWKEEEEKGMTIDGGRARGRRKKGFGSLKRNLSNYEEKKVKK